MYDNVLYRMYVQGCHGWFPVDGEDEMIVLAEPVLAWLARQGHPDVEPPRRGRSRNGGFEIELILATEDVAHELVTRWLTLRHLGLSE